MKWMEPVVSRLAWACTMAVMALVGLVSPDTLMGILDRFATDRSKEKGGRDDA